jgi:AraC family transcriptional regulator, regulatory protein of adaptative response / methylated-DNA-[protein]-cysteine methyltransferase
MEPSRYRLGGHGVQIGYTLADSALGRVLVAATDSGIAAVYLEESDERLEAALRVEFPNADLVRDDAGFQGWVDGVLAQVSGESLPFELPVDVKATAFQWRVWTALRAIPRGDTRTYSQIARALGQPNAARAVARACATNPVAVVIPCHRVIREDGSMGGYRWGIPRKEALLASEKRESANL